MNIGLEIFVWSVLGIICLGLFFAAYCLWAKSDIDFTAGKTLEEKHDLWKK